MTATTVSAPIAASAPDPAGPARHHDLDAVRAFALVLGLVFHASLSFVPVFIGWAVMDVSTSPVATVFMLASHSFRMELFFLIAGFFSHLALHRKGTVAFLQSRFVRLVVPWVIGWFILRPLIVSGWLMGSASLRGEVDVLASLRGGLQSLASLPAGIFAGSHLWFLYYLVLITIAVVAARTLIGRMGTWRARLAAHADRGLGWLARSRVAPGVLTIPTAGLLWFMRTWVVDTPDQGLRPQVPVFLLYGGFFVLGWLLHRNAELIAPFTRVTLSRGLLAALALVGSVLTAGIQRDPGHPHYTAAHVVCVVSYALLMWSLVLLTIGLFRRFFSRPNAVVRYVADASYWMYLIHLPIVVWLQVAVAELPLHWSVKLATIVTATLLFCLVTYDVFVRSTFIGQLLNGRRAAGSGILAFLRLSSRRRRT